MTRRNPVAKHANINRAATHKDRSKEPPSYDLEEGLEECHAVTQVIECPYCGHEHYQEQALLGSLGNLNHYRCRACGGQWENAS